MQSIPEENKHHTKVCNSLNLYFAQFLNILMKFDLPTTAFMKYNALEL